MSNDNPILPGAIFENRKAVAASGLHKQEVRGIWTQKGEALSIVLSGGYEDDEDHGSVIIYTGEGGQDRSSGKQNADQHLTGSNIALVKSKQQNTLINVIRGSKHKSPFSPQEGYQYAGKYTVKDYWPDIGKSGHRIYRFELVQVEGSPADIKPSRSMPNYEPAPTRRKTVTNERVIRDTKQSREVKELYNFACQVCGNAIKLPLGGLYSEGAHIRPLGKPHDGPDHTSNILSLCPNHHVMFDNYAFTIDPTNLRLVGLVSGKLIVHPEHLINLDHVTYHSRLSELL